MVGNPRPKLGNGQAPHAAHGSRPHMQLQETLRANIQLAPHTSYYTLDDDIIMGSGGEASRGEGVEPAA